MDIVFVVDAVRFIANSVIREAALPDFALAAKDGSKGVRVSAFDELDGVLERYIVRRGEQQMDVFGHENEGMELESSFTTIAVESLQKETDVVLNDEQSSALPG